MDKEEFIFQKRTSKGKWCVKSYVLLRTFRRFGKCARHKETCDDDVRAFNCTYRYTFYEKQTSHGEIELSSVINSKFVCVCHLIVEVCAFIRYAASCQRPAACSLVNVSRSRRIVSVKTVFYLRAVEYHHPQNDAGHRKAPHLYLERDIGGRYREASF